MTIYDSKVIFFYFAGLKIADSGNYTCRAGSETGETTASAMLRVYCKELLPFAYKIYYIKVAHL